MGGDSLPIPEPKTTLLPQSKLMSYPIRYGRFWIIPYE